jgi:hypothetical protein
LKRQYSPAAASAVVAVSARCAALPSAQQRLRCAVCLSALAPCLYKQTRTHHTHNHTITPRVHTNTNTGLPKTLNLCHQHAHAHAHTHTYTPDSTTIFPKHVFICSLDTSFFFFFFFSSIFFLKVNNNSSKKKVVTMTIRLAKRWRTSCHYYN